MTTPRHIEPQNIRLGMRVRVEWTDGDVQESAEFVVAQLGSGWAGSKHRTWGFTNTTWTLLADAPTPDRPTGSHWLDPETGAEYVVTDRSGSRYQLYRSGDSAADAIIDADTYVFDGEKIARLTAIPAFDPATLWPHETNGRQCGADTGRWLCCRTDGHDGLHAAYVSSTAGVQPVYCWGDPR